MKRNFYSVTRVLLFVLCLFSATALNAQKGWEQVHSLPFTNAMHLSSEGNLLLADLTYDETSGIYLSTDGGENWSKTNAAG